MGLSLVNKDLPGNKAKEYVYKNFADAASQSLNFGLEFGGALRKAPIKQTKPKFSKEGNPVLNAAKEYVRNVKAIYSEDTPFWLKAAFTVAVAAVVIASIVLIGVLAFAALTGLGCLIAVSMLWGGFLAATRYVYNFNWNQSDKQIAEEIEAGVKNLYGLLGGTLGSATGFLLCGALPGAIAFGFNKSLGAAILRNVGNEAKEEVLQQVAALAWASSQTLANAAFKRLFMGARRWIKKPGSVVHELFKEILGEDNLKKWGEEGQPAYTFSGVIEKKVEKIPDERLKLFTEEFIENFAESCVEAGYVVSNTIESYLAAQKMMQDEALGEERIVEIEFNRSTSPLGK